MGLADRVPDNNRMRFSIKRRITENVAQGRAMRHNASFVGVKRHPNVYGDLR
jgi:hypothetical protein